MGFHGLDKKLEKKKENHVEDNDIFYAYNDDNETKKQKKVRIKEDSDTFKPSKTRLMETIKRDETRVRRDTLNNPKFSRVRKITKKLSKPKLDDKEAYAKAVDLFLKDNYTLFEYQGYDPLLLKSGLEDESSDESGEIRIEPDERSQLNTQNFEYPESDGQSYSRMVGWNGEMNVPPVFKEKYQLSIWKIDPFGVVKIRNKYFTPNESRASEINFSGFKLSLSLDEQTMLMVEKENEKQRDLVIISFDIYSLETINETLVSIVDTSIKNEHYYQGVGSELNINYRGPFQISESLPKIISWNFGTYLLSAVSTSPTSRVIYKFDIYNTQTGALVSTINRASNDLLKNKIIAISNDDEDENLMHFATVSGKEIVVLEVNVVTGEVEELASYEGFLTENAYFSEGNQTIFLISQDKDTKEYFLH